MSRYSLNKVPSDILANVAKKVVSFRKEQGLTQQAIANKSGVSYGSVKRFETSGQISFHSLLKIVHVLGRLHDFDLILNKEHDDSKDNLFSI